MKFALELLYRVAVLAGIGFACYQLVRVREYTHSCSWTLDRCSTWGGAFKVEPKH